MPTRTNLTPLTDAALHHATVSGTTKVVLLALANAADAAGGDTAAIPIADLAEIAGTTDRSAQRALAENVSCGYLEVQRQQAQGGGRRGPRRINQFRVLTACPDTCTGGPAHLDLAASSA